MKIDFLFAWYDFWIGFFWDKKKKWLYFLPIPCIGIVFKFGIFEGELVQCTSWIGEKYKEVRFRVKGHGFPNEGIADIWTLQPVKTIFSEDLHPDIDFDNDMDIHQDHIVRLGWFGKFGKKYKGKK